MSTFIKMNFNCLILPLILSTFKGIYAGFVAGMPPSAEEVKIFVEKLLDDNEREFPHFSQKYTDHFEHECELGVGRIYFLMKLNIALTISINPTVPDEKQHNKFHQPLTDTQRATLLAHCTRAHLLRMALHLVQQPKYSMEFGEKKEEILAKLNGKFMTVKIHLGKELKVTDVRKEQFPNAFTEILGEQ